MHIRQKVAWGVEWALGWPAYVPLAALGRIVTEVLIAVRKRQALHGLSRKQRCVLHEVWREYERHGLYARMYEVDGYRYARANRLTVDRARILIDRCLDAGIELWRIRPWRATKKDPWWFHVFSLETFVVE